VEREQVAERSRDARIVVDHEYARDVAAVLVRHRGSDMIHRENSDASTFGGDANERGPRRMIPRRIPVNVSGRSDD